MNQVNEPLAQVTAIYVITVRPVPDDHVRFALRALQGLAGRCVVICPADYVTEVRALLGDRPGDQILTPDAALVTTAAGYKQGLAWIWAQGKAACDVILTGSHVIGPLLPLDARALDLAGQDADLFSPYWHNADLDIRIARSLDAGRLPSLDFAVIAARLLANPGFKEFWTRFQPSTDFWEEFQRLNLAFGLWLKSDDRRVIYPVAEAVLETYDPMISEIHKLVAHDVPCLPISVLRLDPVLHDLYATDLRIALDDLRQRHPQVYRLAIGYASHNIPPRDFAMAADLYEVLPLTATDPAKTEWDFGRIAIFIHAFYAEMMPEFWELIARMPCAYDLFVTTSTPEIRNGIETFLRDKGVAAKDLTVVVVEQNRGRDMSSLFITFREAALSGRYKVALRLHSKRTPQVSRQVGENFKKYLFENLVASRGYIANILDRFEQEPDIGMIMPPVVHVGFGTLGHSWFNNFQPMAVLAHEMDLRVNYDIDTPLAPLGTMYWFRPDALFKMFDWEWKWADYNPEPRHIDGGLAHVQERLICYACVDRGYRVVMAMTPAQAGRSYAKLEYKLQLLAARLASGNVMIQRDELDQLRVTTRSVILRKLMETYGAIVRRYPGARRTLRPIGHFIRRVLHPQSQPR